MATKEEIFAEATALGIPTTPDMHHFAVTALIKKFKEANPSDDSTAGGGGTTLPNSQPNVTNPVTRTPPTTQTVYKLEAKFRAKNADGDIEVIKINSEGTTIEAALAAFAFPAGLNSPIRLSVTGGSRDLEVMLAPHVARKILGNKSLAEFQKRFGFN
jgi:hypothetical protein